MSAKFPRGGGAIDPLASSLLYLIVCIAALLYFVFCMFCMLSEKLEEIKKESINRQVFAILQT